VPANPLAALLADHTGERRRLMAVLAAVGVAATALFALADSFVALLAITVLATATVPTLIPLGDNVALLAGRSGALDYGRVRLWGSLAFIAASAAAGRMLSGSSADTILWLVLGGVALTFAACLLMPDLRLPPARLLGLAPARLLLSSRLYLLLLVAAGAIQASHAAYYGFATLHWRAAGLGDATIGWLWAEGVVAEIVLFSCGAALVRRLGPAGLLALAGAAGAARWGVTATSTALPALAVVQALHAFTFGAAHLGAMHFLGCAVPPARSATAQGLYAAIVSGAGFGVAALAAGALYDAFAGGAFWAMGGFACAGAAAALVLAASWDGGEIIARDAGAAGTGGCA
jgi:MFS transporter, PPP family, 3-phenylpropionic acid transporter